MFILKKFKSKKTLAATLSAIMLFSLFSPITVKAAEDEIVNIQLIATSDFHGRFYPYDYAQNKEDKSGSLAQIATVVKEYRSKNPNTIVVDAGDTIQENSAEIFFKSNPEYKLEGNPMIKAFNEIGYDSVTLGNHEFNGGIDKLKEAYGTANAKVLSANVYEKDGKTRMYGNYTIVEKGGVKVAILGITTPNITRWDEENLNGYKVTNPIDEAKAAIKEIKDGNKADVIIATVHMSEGDEYDVHGSGVVNLLKDVQGLDFVVAGHGHKIVDDTTVNTDNPGKFNVYNGVKMIENDARGKTIGKVDIKVTKKDGKYIVADRVNDVTAKITKIKDVTPDTEMMTSLKSYNDFAITDANKIIGKLVDGNLSPENEIDKVPQAQLQETPLINLINEVQMHYSGADVAASAIFDASSPVVKEGEFKKADSSLIYKYENTLYSLKMTGTQLKKYMEWSASYYNQYKPGDLTISFNPTSRLYNYDMFSGVKFGIDISKPVGSRIVNLTKMDGTAIKDEDSVKVAVNNYRANTQLLSYGPIFKAGEALPEIIEKDIKSNIGGVRELIGDYIKNVKGGIISPKMNNNWKVTGNNWDPTLRKVAVQALKDKEVTLPAGQDPRAVNSVSLTVEDLKKATGNKFISLASINDIHGALVEQGKNVGVAKLATVFNDYKAENPNTILVSAGDNYQGSALSNLLTGEPMNKFFKANEFVASAIGNHEFDWGVVGKDGTNMFEKWSKDSGMDFLASNIYLKGTKDTPSWAKPYKIVEKDGVKIGIIGITTPQTVFQTKAENVKDYEFRDPVETVNYWADLLKNKGVGSENVKVDAVVVLSHLGTFQDAKTKEITGEGAEVAKSAKNIDAVITAHSHQEVAGMVNGIPVIQTGYNGRNIGKINLVFDSNNKLLLKEANLDKVTTRAKEIAPNKEVKDMLDIYVNDVKPLLDEVVGYTNISLDHDRKAIKGTSPLGYYTAKVMAKVAGVQIGITNGGGLRTPIAKGEITMGNLYDVMPFDNTLVKMNITGTQLKKVMENGIDNTEIGWVQVAGIKIYYNEKAAFGSRITKMILDDGTVVKEDGTYSVVTNDFMSTGGDKFDFSKGVSNLVDMSVPIRDALVKELKETTSKDKPLDFKFEQVLIAGDAPAIDTTTPDNNGGTTTPDNNGGTTTPDNNGGTTIPDNNGGTTTPDNNGGTITTDNNGGTIIPNVNEVKTDSTSDGTSIKTGQGIPKTGAPIGATGIAIISVALIASGLYLTKKKAA
ncbi:5'-nucleotidase C-terminal domain-containing protein [Clostridium gasigenes]|uniref:5'-nucleotidase C-terminal domain-containing protein n=1 Tax=Clostridium gasigenes TaxID=94869 RepID=UPI001C0CEC9E|nr:5'-nucleotidase C-terminal domain-containing protein [Clostridium gasigenes]MBU3136122.1 5'-nucleotidase C-terminal domain-containing protein [Clostridium gasigenes]